MNPILPHLNPWAILIAGAAYWLLGSLWFSVLAGKLWSTELQKLGVVIKEPTKIELRMKLLTTFVLNVFLAIGMSALVHALNLHSIAEALFLGLLVGLCFAAATLGVTYTWESRSLRLYMIDAGYPVLGIILCAIILTLWQ